MDRFDLHAAMLQHMMVSIWAGKGHGLTLPDFMPKFGMRKEQVTDDGYVAPEDMLKMIEGVMGQQDRRKELERKRAEVQRALQERHARLGFNGGES